MKNGTCPKCGAANVLMDAPVKANVMTGHGGGQLTVSLTEPPDEHKWIQSVHTEHFTFHAWICAACGYTEFYVHEGDKFHQAWEKNWCVDSK
jgi:predicted nucleic-acid-binding Zn-ribbon protein